jgi:hypothetical protein
MHLSHQRLRCFPSKKKEIAMFSFLHWSATNKTARHLSGESTMEITSVASCLCLLSDVSRRYLSASQQNNLHLGVAKDFQIVLYILQVMLPRHNISYVLFVEYTILCPFPVKLVILIWILVHSLNELTKLDALNPAVNCHLQRNIRTHLT